jgi:hypothetical protein
MGPSALLFPWAYNDKMTLGGGCGGESDHGISIISMQTIETYLAVN